MSRFYHCAAINDYFHMCDYCEKKDGRSTIVFKDKDFALCSECIEKLFLQHVALGFCQKEHIIVKRKVVSEDIRKRVFSRDGNECKECGAKEDLHLDHIMPFSSGGGTDIDNLQTLCRSCNSRKADKVNV